MGREGDTPENDAFNITLLTARLPVTFLLVDVHLLGMT